MAPDHTQSAGSSLSGDVPPHRRVSLLFPDPHPHPIIPHFEAPKVGGSDSSACVQGLGKPEHRKMNTQSHVVLPHRGERTARLEVHKIGAAKWVGCSGDRANHETIPLPGDLTVLKIWP